MRFRLDTRHPEHATFQLGQHAEAALHLGIADVRLSRLGFPGCQLDERVRKRAIGLSVASVLGPEDRFMNRGLVSFASRRKRDGLSYFLVIRPHLRPARQSRLHLVPEQRAHVGFGPGGLHDNHQLWLVG